MSSKTGPVWAIVPASGVGHRMQGQKPKQYLPLDGKTIIEHTLDRLLSFDGIDGVVLVLRPDDRDWQTINYQSEKPLITTSGGELRQHSVFNGLLKLLEQKFDDPYAMVHDAVRPLVCHADLRKLIEAAIDHSAGALLALPITDTLKHQDQDSNIDRTVPRAGLWRAFTPQLFKAKLLHRALEQVIENDREVTDDASAIESLGLRPRLVECNAENIKITWPEDLSLATQILRRQREENCG
ncbi:MAG: 2-C-methyl-D-erythritol 4-phosphate cytidylyltransferase [Gammaproteobacteria bacterium]|nr:2-C-methyl-D-erythritol 4-phosphate cytidylyltransferase [Gammaproteobacteria bacterium]MCZ6668510.1 2-C-methyl-D-erythritol 4-phosphate cytidylyltransferase [Gammaproteobacteria bacterium]